MSSVFTQDQRYLAWNFFMLHLMNDVEFSQLNNDPATIYPEWADNYAEKVIKSMSDLLKTATRESLTTPATIEIPPYDCPSPPMPIDSDEPYQGLLMIAPRLDAMPSSPSSLSSESSPFTDRDSPLTSSSASEESVPTFSKVIVRPVPIPVIRTPSSGYVSPNSSSSGSSSALVLSGDSCASSVRPRPRRRRGGQRMQQRINQQQPPPPSSSQQQQADTPMCSFCRRNSEPKEFYTSHNTKDSKGNVICPILSAYKCEACGATGRDAHTRSHCPMASVIREIFSDDSNYQVRYSNYARTARSPQ